MLTKTHSERLRIKYVCKKIDLSSCYVDNLKKRKRLAKDSLIFSVNLFLAFEKSGLFEF